ncbi:hypothetical protein P154DRAFT_481801 [Amniculicola lignicola CBS 123094]|uniref:Protein EFR3 n=1 Tax=Amniculicola lignicola CBS 123094 TaxID=1392246 RepID=A0A6A5WYQ6_9PLEO|nr:hypothetical protein P154DRAFT_481801 [Amniculicola lignicola CBS 123094]
MNAARQACRPKHQVLVLKCYPKYQKNDVEVKPNSSELAYLLYYASTRRSKLQKVGDFLDKRTTTDVWKGRLGNVQVTLEILKALMEKSPRDLPLYAGAVLRILRTILKSGDVTMVEASVPTFETLCAHQDPATLAADQDYITQYEEVVQLYAEYASKTPVKNAKTAVPWPVAIRFRKAALQALKAVASADSLGSETGRQLAVIIPAILNNIWAESGEYLRRLDDTDQEREEHDKEDALRRRQSTSGRRHSISTVPTNEDAEGDAIAASGTTEDADKRTEEEVGVIALQALRNIFVGVNRGQLRLATSAVLKFIGTHVKPEQDVASQKRTGSWPMVLVGMICGWAPVQDRYAILVGAMETLVRSPIVEDDMERQLVLATVIDYLLGSTVNFIGLSVMDVLVGLISHVLLLLQLGGQGSSIKPHQQQTTSVMGEKDPNPKTTGDLDGVVVEVVKQPSTYRIQLLDTVQHCMSNLATHVYYTDQVSDMVAAILSRLKPHPASAISNTVAAIEDPNGAVDAVANSVSLNEKAQVNGFFSFETARISALEAVKNIIITANQRRPDGSSASVSRSPVGVRVWEGTQWLLRDPSGKVRRAYVDALVTWLNLEKKKADLQITDGYHKKEREGSKGDLARRAVSNASQREKSPRRFKDTFLSLLHLAVYENALQYVDSEQDILLLHLLLTTLVNKLGVNAVRTGQPMIFRLQEDIPSIENPVAKVRIGSLVHGYFWALSHALDFEVSSIGRTLHAEISRRNNKGLWLQSIRVPAMPLERIEAPHPDKFSLPTNVVHTEALNPFDNREALVDRISDGYSSSLYSPPASPPGSPGRSLSVSILAPPTSTPAPQLPTQAREDLLAEWSRDICIATNTKDSSSASMTGSRTATSYQQRNNFLGIQIPNGNLDSVNNSPVPTPRRAHSRPPSTAYGLVGRMHSPHGTRSPSATPGSTSSLHSAVRVEDLKRVLSGSAPRTSYSMRPASHRQRDSASEVDSSASESMMSLHSLSDSSFVTADHASPRVNQTQLAPDSPSTPAATLTPRASANMNVQSSNATREHNTAYAGDVPPVPPIPVSLRDQSTSPIDSTPRPKTAPAPTIESNGIGIGNGNGNGNGSMVVRKSRSVKQASGATTTRGRSGGRSISEKKTPKKPDFSGFLDSIDIGDEGEDDGASVGTGVGRAPY